VLLHTHFQAIELDEELLAKTSQKIQTSQKILIGITHHLSRDSMEEEDKCPSQITYSGE
jgi:hypothetical protein